MFFFLPQTNTKICLKVSFRIQGNGGSSMSVVSMLLLMGELIMEINLSFRTNGSR